MLLKSYIIVRLDCLLLPTSLLNSLIYILRVHYIVVPCFKLVLQDLIGRLMQTSSIQSVWVQYFN